jgi:hypothetical protein
LFVGLDANYSADIERQAVFPHSRVSRGWRAIPARYGVRHPFLLPRIKALVGGDGGGEGVHVVEKCRSAFCDAVRDRNHSHHW